MLTPRPSFIVAVALLGQAAPALAIPIPPPTVCRGPSYAIPLAGTTIPANTPELELRPNDDYRLPRTIEYHDIQLRDGSGALVPTTIRPEPLGPAYLVRPMRALAVGEATLSFLEDCPPGQNERLAVPVRNEAIRYTVVPAVPFPTRIGKMSARVVEYRWHPERPDRPEYALIRFELEPTPELEAFKNTLRLELHLDEGNTSGTLPLWPELTPETAPNVWEGGHDCDAYEGFAGRKATWNFQLTAELPGADELVIPSMTIPLEVDCTARPAPAGNNTGAPHTGTPHGGAHPPHQHGGGCAYLPVGASGLPALLMLAMAAFALVSRRR